MAEDGTGGVVYLKRVDGVAHVFVSRYHRRTLAGPDASRRRTALRGQLAAYRRRRRRRADRRVGDALCDRRRTTGRRASRRRARTRRRRRLGRRSSIDPNIQDATGTSPDLAVSSTGQADVVYRVVQPRRDGNPASASRRRDRAGSRRPLRRRALDRPRRDQPRTGALDAATHADQRAAASRSGRPATAVVVWQEPEIERRRARSGRGACSGATLDYVLPVSAAKLQRPSVRSDADAPSVAVSTLGQAVVAYRQNVGAGLAARRAAHLPEHASRRRIRERRPQFLGARVADSATGGWRRRHDRAAEHRHRRKQETRLLYDANGSPRIVEGNDQGVLLERRLARARLRRLRTGGGQRDEPRRRRHLCVAERGCARATPLSRCARTSPSGAVQTALVGGGAGGEVGELSVGRSGLGDGLVAFRQGPFGNAAIVAARASAPPAQFQFSVPKGWIPPSRARVSWNPAASANGPLTYKVDPRRPAPEHACTDTGAQARPPPAR